MYPRSSTGRFPYDRGDSKYYRNPWELWLRDGLMGNALEMDLGWGDQRGQSPNEDVNLHPEGGSFGAGGSEAETDASAKGGKSWVCSLAALWPPALGREGGRSGVKQECTRV